ncbi:MAG: hypothetical protein ACTHY8_06230 [Microbacterium gubbeenense]|uniref:hypothetical protein n=1 Tax=Microbacterium TaxID=33882 RepID=UPI0004240135|nr:hypothetical protein [Microbacterium gubbeenense]
MTTNLEAAHLFWRAHDEMCAAADAMMMAKSLAMGLQADMAWRSPTAAQQFSARIEELLDLGHHAVGSCAGTANTLLEQGNKAAAS